MKTLNNIKNTMIQFLKSLTNKAKNKKANNLLTQMYADENQTLFI
jgi:hypothetical protein